MALDTPSLIKERFSLTYRLDLFPAPFANPSSQEFLALSEYVMISMPMSRQVFTLLESSLSYYLPEAELNNICTFLDSFKAKHPFFVVEVFTNNLESAYVEIFSNSEAAKVVEQAKKNMR